MGLPAANIGLRTSLTYFLQAEIEKAHARGIPEPPGLTETVPVALRSPSDVGMRHEAL